MMVSKNRAIYLFKCSFWHGSTFLAHWCEILFLALDYKHTTAKRRKGRVRVACSLFVSRFKDKFPFWAQRSMVKATFILCSNKALSDYLEGAILNSFSGGSPHTPSFSRSSSTSTPLNIPIVGIHAPNP